MWQPGKEPRPRSANLTMSHTSDAREYMPCSAQSSSVRARPHHNCGPCLQAWAGATASSLLTYTLTLTENGLNVLYPYITGIAIDAVLSGAWAGVAPLLIAWTVHLAVGLFRHVYDTRVFTLVYADLAADLVERQRAQGANAAHLAARVTLSREVIDFLQVEVPAVTASFVNFVGAVAMLFVLNLWVGALALGSDVAVHVLVQPHQPAPECGVERSA